MFSGILGCALLFARLLLGVAAAGDFYPNVAALKADRVSGVDYRIEWDDRRSSFTVLAIHGGEIEWGTSEIARAVAGGDWNLYLFEGLKHSESRRLHVTATHFDDPQALAAVGASLAAVAVHGMDADRKESRRGETCVGGGNAEMRARVAEALRRAGFLAEEPCRILPGEDSQNIVNRAQKKGTQLEMSPQLIASLLKSPKLLEGYVQAVRASVLSYVSGVKGTGGR